LHLLLQQAAAYQQLVRTQLLGYSTYRLGEAGALHPGLLACQLLLLLKMRGRQHLLLLHPLPRGSHHSAQDNTPHGPSFQQQRNVIIWCSGSCLLIPQLLVNAGIN
jgi:hypothetical protein